MRKSYTRAATVVVAMVAATASIGAGDGPVQAAASSAVRVVTYDSGTIKDYQAKWSNIYGPLDNATTSITGGTLQVSDVPFKTGVDFSVFDHLKYIAVSNQTFPAPANGTVAFSVDITASTPGAVDGHVVHGQYGPPGSYDPTKPDTYVQPVMEGQQAGVVLNMIDFCTGQLFDWFVSSNYAFALIERLPTAITGNTSNPNCAGAGYVGLDKAYTQIVKQVPITAGVAHNVVIAYSQSGTTSNVTYLIDKKVVASVQNVGIPLDVQGVPYSGTYPSLGGGEPLASKITSFAIGHGLFSLLDAFPFQYGCTAPTASGPGACDPATAPYSVSIPASERAFGQGARGSFNHFTVATTGS